MKRTGIAIVGGGIAGQSLCEEIRARDSQTPLTLICGEPRIPYDRVRLSELLVGGEDPALLELRSQEWYQDTGVDLMLGRQVERIDTSTKRLGFADGEELCYERLALATGSEPAIPPISGLELSGVLAFRGPEDCERIRSAAQRAHKVAVIGGGLLGLEAAYGVAAQGCSVTVVHLMERLMERQLDSWAAAMLLPAMRELGVEVLLEHQTDAVLGTKRVQGLRFVGGEELSCDLVVVSVGIKPQTQLAHAAGIECGRGIVVDDYMRTSADDVVAVGECAEHRGKVYGLVAPIYEQAKTAARTLSGGATEPYEGSLEWAKLKVMGVDCVAIGSVEDEREASAADKSAGIYRKLAVDSGGRPTGAILIGDTRGTEDLLQAIRSAEAVADPLARLAQAQNTTAGDLDAGAQICDCNGVCKQDIVSAVETDGCKTPREVTAMTKAGAGCGSCKPMVAEIVALALGGEVREEPAYLCPCRKQTREELAHEIRTNEYEAVSELAAGCGSGRDCGLCKPGLSYLVSEINANRHREERSARFINDRVHANIQNDGTFSVVPRMYGGVTNTDELRRIADAADRYGARMVKLTGGQRIDLLGIKKQDLPRMWEDIGMPSGHAYAKAIRTVKSCVGSEFCRYGLGETISLAQRIEREWEGVYTPHKVKSGVSGCPRNCAEATVKDIGVVCVEGGWQLRIGGAAGATVREADTLTTVKTHDEVVQVATAVLQYYRENAEYKERLYDFVPRVGLGTIYRQVTEPSSQAALRERFAIAKAAARDPWLERERPYHRNQFRELETTRALADKNGSEQTGLESGADEGSAVVGPPEGARR